MGSGHENSGRHPFIGDITNQDADLVVSKREHIIEIASHLPSREDASAEIELLMHGQDVWQNRHLDIGSHFQLSLQALFLDQLFLRGLQFVERLLQLAVLFTQVAKGGRVRVIQALAQHTDHLVRQFRMPLQQALELLPVHAQ